MGKFQIVHRNGILDEETIHSEKLVKLLSYLLMHQDRSLTVQELSENIWQEEETDNPAGALKNLMYRLRILLKTYLGEEEFLLSGRGTYSWNPAVRVVVDAEEFERLCELATERASQEHVKKERVMFLYEEAIQLYNGDFLAKKMDESWIIPLSTYYHSLFLTSVKHLLKLFEENDRYEEIEGVCTKALKHDLLDENLHCSLIRSLIRQNKMKLAKEHYEKATKILFEELNIKDTECLKAVYKELLDMGNIMAADIQEDMNELERPEGVYLCGYPLFREIFRLESRRISRLGIVEYVLLLTLNLKKENTQIQEGMGKYLLNAGMKQMEEVLMESLRMGDVASRYSDTQYIILLSSCVYETAVMIADRILFHFNENISALRIQVKIDMEEVSAVSLLVH